MLIHIEGKNYIVGNAYVPPENSEGLKNYLNSCDKALKYATMNSIEGVLSLGDFNCRHPMWKDHKHNQAGNNLAQYLTTSNYTVISPGTHTYECHNGTSLIDLSLISDNLKDSIDMCIVDYDHPELLTGVPGRGHYPVKTILKVNGRSKVNNVKKTVYDLKSANWATWASVLDASIASRSTEFDELSTPESIDDLLRNCIESAKKQVMQTKVLCTHSKPYWTPELSQLSKRVRMARKSFKANNSLVNKQVLEECKAEFTDKLNNAINTWTQKASSNLNTKEQATFWKEYTKQFKIKDENSTKIDILVNKEGDLVLDEQGKAELFYESFFTGNHLVDCEFDNNHKENVDKMVKELVIEETNKADNSTVIHDETELSYEDADDCSDDINKRFTMTELTRALNKIKTSNKCFDGDDVHPLYLKNCGPKFRERLLELTNTCLETHAWPWETAKVTMLRKPNKNNYQNPGAYRPISITSYIGKILERMIDYRLRDKFLVDQSIDEEQEGYMPHRSTTRYLYRLCCEINNSKNNKKVGLLLLIDFEKAYDSVWIEGLLYKLHKAEITGNIWLLIAAFLTNRYVKIGVGEFISERRKCAIGLPQGSVLAPLLFAFYISDMLNNTISKKFKFADDATLYTDAANKYIIMENMQNDINRIYSWTKLWRFKVNCDKGKTELIGINFEPEDNDNIHLGNKMIEFVKKSKVLGVWIDKGLKWEDQVNSIRGKLWNQWINIKKLVSCKYGLKKQTIIKLVKIGVLPLLFYCAPVWLDSGNNIALFNDIWNDILKTSLGISFNPNRSKMEVLCDMPPLEIQVQSIIIKFLIKNFMIHEEDNLKQTIKLYKDTNRHFVRQHIVYLKQYYTHQSNLRSVHQVQLEDYENVTYTKATVNRFVKDQWKRRLEQLPAEDEGIKWTEVMAQNQSLPLLPRKLEVLFHGLILEHFPGNKFMWNLSQVASPMCSCNQELETGYHLLIECINYAQHRSNDIAASNMQDIIRQICDKTSTNKEAKTQYIQDLKLLLGNILATRFKGETRIKKYMLKDSNPSST